MTNEAFYASLDYAERLNWTIPTAWNREEEIRNLRDELEAAKKKIYELQQTVKRLKRYVVLPK